MPYWLCSETKSRLSIRDSLAHDVLFLPQLVARRAAASCELALDVVSSDGGSDVQVGGCDRPSGVEMVLSGWLMWTVIK